MNTLVIPEGLKEVEELLGRIDTCFELGFSRLGADQFEGLASVARTFTGTPLGDRLREAVEGLSRAEFREEHFVTIAAARQALQGAQYDALVEHALAQGVAFQRASIPIEKVDPTHTPPEITTWMQSTRQWLVEVALAGFMQLEQETVLPFIATLEQLQQRQESARLAMLLSGMVHEWLDAMPMGSLESVPLRRWSDLWARAMVSALALPAYPAAEEVSGTLHLLGADLRHHSHAMSAVFHGVLLRDGEPPRQVRLHASGYKVDVLDEDEVWQVLDLERFDALIEAYTREKALNLKDMQLLPSGDLLWDASQAKIGASSNTLAIAREHLNTEQTFLVDTLPLDRHPVQIAIPVFLQDYGVEGKKNAPAMLRAGEFEVEIDELRCGGRSEVSPKAIAASDACMGLLRFDAGSWTLQPLALWAKAGKVSRIGASATLKIKSGSSIAILKERAGKLLRVKS